MNHDRTPQSLELQEVAQECANQENLYRSHGAKASNPGFCYELFRRAIVKRVEDAWTLAYKQYEPQVISWIRQHPAYKSTGQDPECFVSEAFARFWRAVSADLFTKKLKSLASVLLYLKKCVASTLQSYHRSLKKEGKYTDLGDDYIDVVDAVVTRPSEDVFLQTLDSEQLWTLIDSLLKSEKEKIVVENRFVLGKKTKQIQAEYPHLFADTKTIYRIQENILKRLRRNQELINLVAG